MSHYRPKKRFGQNFLIKESIAARIVKTINPLPGDNIVEIGPGKGALTRYLLGYECNVTAIEFDRDIIPLLNSNFTEESNLEIVEKDIMLVEPNDLPSRFKFIGNLPFNISTAIIERLYEFKESLEIAVFTVQAEVANRLTASPGVKDYGSLTVIMKAGFDITHLFNISPKAFRPEPKVDSSVIKITPIERDLENLDEFKTFIRGCFRQKRKTLANSMQIGLNLPKDISEGMIARAGHGTDIRAEQLSFDEYMELYGLWRGLQK